MSQLQFFVILLSYKLDLLEMRSSIVYFFIIFIYSVNLVYPKDNSMLSIAICEIIEKFYKEYSRNIDIVEIGGSHDELISEIMKNINNSIAVTVQKRKYWKQWTHAIQNQSIYLFNNFQDLSEFSILKPIDIRYLNPIRIIAYYTNASASEIASLNTNLLIIPLYYFIIPDQNDEKLKLYTFNNNLAICTEKLRLYEVNEFSIKDRKWVLDPIFPKKFQNFHGCIMELGFYNFTNLFFTHVVDDILTVNSFLIDLMKAVSKHLNFIPNMMVCYKLRCEELITSYSSLYNILIIETLEGNAIQFIDNFRWLHSFMNIECR